MKKWKNKKRLLILAAVLLVLAIVAGFCFLPSGGGEVVGVYPFQNVGMTEYWGDNQESYGPVSTDKIQTVFLSDTQTVTEILVKAGDKVKAGDVLMTFDTTLSGLELERKRLAVEKMKLQITIAQQELQEIRAMKPMEKPEDLPEVTPTEPILGDEKKDAYEAYFGEDNAYDGKTLETSFICWIRDDTGVDDALLETLRQKVHNLTDLCEHSNDKTTCTLCAMPKCAHGVTPELCEICYPKCEHGIIQQLCDFCRACEHGEDCLECPCEHALTRKDCAICNPPICVHGQPAEVCPDCMCEHNVIRKACSVCTPVNSSGVWFPDLLSAFEQIPYQVQLLSGRTGWGHWPGDNPEQETEGETAPPAAEETEPVVSQEEYYVVFKITEGNYQLGATTTWQGVHVTGKGSDFSLKYFVPTISDYFTYETDSDGEGPALPEYDMGSGYTLAQIIQMINNKEKEIKDLEFKLKLEEADYKIMLKELEDGNIYAAIDGEVLSVLTEEESRQNRQPVIKVSAGGGFLVEVSVSELEKDKLTAGQEVTVNDWNTGMTYTGTVQSVGDFPSADGYWNGMGNPNTTYYPFTVFVDGTADLQAGSYVSVMYASSASENGIYLEKPFIREEQGRSYVYVLGSGGKLEKRDVVTGKSLWGSYTEILSGITEEDLIAFPYGKAVKPGAPAEERDISELYSY